MDLLKERIRREGKVLPGNIIKVDGFLNHRVDTKLMAAMAEEFEKHFDVSRATVVLTAEASGIALATMCAYRYGLPLIYAKKAKSDNIEGGIIKSDIYSYTYKKKVTLMVSAEWLKPTDKVLIIDDFLANGEALRGLCEIVSSAGAEMNGCAVHFIIAVTSSTFTTASCRSRNAFSSMWSCTPGAPPYRWSWRRLSSCWRISLCLCGLSWRNCRCRSR